MSKRYNIRWRPDDNEQLRKAVKNFNAKISRLERKDPKNKAALPDRVSVKQLKEMIDTRQDLNRELNALKRFSKRGSEQIIDAPENKYNLKMTKWQKEEMTRRTAVVNRRRKQKLKEVSDIQLKSRGEKLGYTKGQFGMGKADEVSLSPIRAFTPSMNRQDLKRKYNMLVKESRDWYWEERDIRLKRNYIQSLESNFNPADIKDVVDEIEMMDTKTFRSIFEAEGGNFELSYPPDDETYRSYLEGIKSIWKPNKAPKKTAKKGANTQKGGK